MRPFAAGATVLVLACGDNRPGEWSGTIDTLRSGATHVLNPERGLWDGRPPWQIVEVAKIGTQLDSGPDVFGRISDIDVDAEGRVYILDRQAQKVRLFDRDGSYIRTIGKVGGGPGEFRVANGIALDPAGRLWVHNMGNLRYSVFDASGRLLMEPRRPATGVNYVNWHGVFNADGDLFERGGYRTSEGWFSGLFRYDTTDERLVDVHMLRSQPASGRVRPFSTISTLTSNGRWIGNKYTYRLLHTTFDGDTVRLIDRAREADHLSTAQRDSAQQYERQLKRRTAQDDFELETELRPIFERLILDDLDHLWVMLSAEPERDSTSFDLFDPIGRYLGQLSAPYMADWTVLPIIRAGRVHYVAKDELDVQYVVIADVTGRP